MTDNKTALGLCAIALVGLSACGSSETGGGTAEPEAAAVEGTEQMRAAVAAAAPSDAAGDACGSEGEIVYACGVAHAEDIVGVGAPGWLVASRLTPLGGTVGAGGLYLIDVQARTVRDLFPSD